MSDLDNITTSGLAATEAECAAGRTAPRVSLSDIEDNIVQRDVFNAAAAVEALLHPSNHPSLGLLTICLLVLRNGFTIIGKSAPASPENFDADLGAKLAYEDAVRQCWPLMGYALREKLFHMEQGAGELAVANLDAAEQGGFHPHRPTAQIPMPEGFEQFVGTKTVFAKPMTRQEYNDLRGWELPGDEDGSDDGYLVEYTDGGKPNVEGFEGYISWSPKDVFDRAYTPNA